MSRLFAIALLLIGWQIERYLERHYQDVHAEPDDELNHVGEVWTP